MKEAVTIFEDLIRKMLAPACAFFVFIYAGHVIMAHIFVNAKHPDFIYFAQKGIDIKSVWLILIGVLGLSYALSTFKSLFFDERLKGNFNNKWRKTQDDLLLDTLREEAIGLLKDMHSAFKGKDTVALNDYWLYQIVTPFLKDRSGITPKTIGAQASGMVFVSIMFAQLELILYYHKILGALGYIILLLAFFATWYLGYWFIRKKYRLRAIRLYSAFIIENKEPEEKGS